MLTGPDTPLSTVILAVADSIHALDAASVLDMDRTGDDRDFFAARKALLAPLLTRLIAAERAIEDHDLAVGSRLQAFVEIGDKVLDRGIGDGNARAKLALKGKAGLGAAHVFGQQVTTLTKEKIALEPQAVLKAMNRMEDVPDFAEKAGIVQDLTARANQQQGCLDEREEGRSARAKLVSTGIKLVVEAAEALATLKGALDQRFPLQKDYVAAFFRDVSPRRTKREDEEPSPGGTPPT